MKANAVSITTQLQAPKSKYGVALSSFVLPSASCYLRRRRLLAILRITQTFFAEIHPRIDFPV